MLAGVAVLFLPSVGLAEGIAAKYTGVAPTVLLEPAGVPLDPLAVDERGG